MGGRGGGVRPEGEGELKYKLIKAIDFGPLSDDTGDWGRHKYRFIFTQNEQLHLGFSVWHNHVSLQVAFWYVELNWRSRWDSAMGRDE